MEVGANMFKLDKKDVQKSLFDQNLHFPGYFMEMLKKAGRMIFSFSFYAN